MADVQQKPMKRQKIQQLSAEEHVRKRSAVYFGSSLNTESENSLIFDENWRPSYVTCLRSKALEKAFDEVLINARDHAFRKGSGVKNIWVQHLDDGTVIIHNDGKGLRLEKVKKADGGSCWSPELAFGNLRAGDNFDDSQERTTGGCNGVGAKLTNLFSIVFQVETRWLTKMYRQKWENRMSQCGAPTIEKIVPGSRFSDFRGTRILFVPRYDLFGIAIGEKSIGSFLRRRCLEIAATTPKVAVHFNGQRVPVSNLKEYATLFVGADSPMAHLKSKKSERWECVAVPKTSDDMPTQISFVNGIPTTEGGQHVVAYNSLGKAIADAVSTKKEAVKPALVRKNITLFVSCVVDRPQFNHQGKTKLESKKQSWGSEPDLSAKQLQKAVSALKEHIQCVLLEKNQDSLSALSRRRRLVIPKLDDALHAGKAKSDCALIVTEGDSAKALAVAGIAAVRKGRETFGVFPLRGKLLNTRGASAAAIQKNAEIMNICRIVGLIFGKQVPREKLRYRKIMIMTDQDDDGSHIKGLLINFLESKFPYCLSWENFVGVFHTPRRRAKKGSEVVDFYNDDEYERWAEGRDLRGWKQKYYKGLGTWTSKDARAMFAEFDHHVRFFRPMAEGDVQRLMLAFEKTMADERKQWLSIPPPPPTGMATSVGQFVDEELARYFLADNDRSIPSVIDGLKPSQRKILCTCLRSNVTSDLRVAQLAAKVSETMMYHHGEVSLQSAIVKMAQDFMGSNNLNLLFPSGQFGTRLANPVGSDSAAARYIHTRRMPYTRALFPEHLILENIVEDGEMVEPTAYFPVIPLLLVNGAAGIGTGYSTMFPPHHIGDVIDTVKALLSGSSGPEKIRVHWKNFKGAVIVEPHKGHQKITAKGIYEVQGGKTIVTELPPGVSTEKFVEEVAKKLEVDCVKRGDTENVNILIDAACPSLPLMEKVYFTSNMHAFAPDGSIKKYGSADDVLKDYMAMGQKVYEKSLAKKIMDVEVEERSQRRRRDYIDLFCRPEEGETIIFPLEVEQLSRLMARKGWPESVDDLVDSVKDREKTVEGSQRALRRAESAHEELVRWRQTTWREMWHRDVEIFERKWRATTVSDDDGRDSEGDVIMN